MAIHFAAPPNGPGWPRHPGLDHPMPQAANDNGPAASRDITLHEALRFFARHGLASAEQAHREAEAAFFAGDRESYRSWLAICRVLDRRLATRLAAKTGDVA